MYSRRRLASGPSDGLYELHIENNGDADEGITVQFRFTKASAATALKGGGRAERIPLISSGVTSGLNPAALNARETFTIDMVRSRRRAAA